jgi:oligopeptide transport system ATP-binding protein
VYQDPFGSLDPRWTVFSIVEEPLGAHRIGSRRERRERAAEVLDLVGLDPGLYGKRKPRQLSGGQCQRVAIARSLVLSPSLVLCDEAVSSLDVLSQAQVLNLFEKLRAELALSYLFVAHDLALVKQVSDRVAVMYMGRLCEVGPSQALYAQPLHPYTAALLDSIPSPEPADRHRRRRRPRVRGEVPYPLPPGGTGVRDGPAAAAGDRPGPPGRLPLPPRRRGRLPDGGHITDVSTHSRRRSTSAVTRTRPSTRPYARRAVRSR